MQKTLEAQAHQHLLSAMEHLASRSLAQAESCLKEAQSKAPEHPQVHYLFGELAIARGDRAGAMGHVACALGWERKRPEPFVLLARLLQEEGDSPMAAQLLERALDLDPRHLPAQSLLREVLRSPQERTTHPEFASLARKATVGVAMIVKNEAKHLARALRSLRGHVDEVVVVDTGSTDATVAIAKAMGARVFFFQWVGDFSAARNFSLAQLNTDWALVLDGDETLELPQGYLAKLLETMPMAEHTGHVPLVRVKQINHHASLVASDPWESVSIARLFPRALMKFQGAAHECPVFLSELQYAPKIYLANGIELHHMGYFPENIHSADKLNRNIELLKKRIEDDANDIEAHYFLGRECVYAGHMEEGLRALNAYVEGLTANHLSSKLLLLTPYLQAVALGQLGRHEEALGRLDEAIALDADYPSYPFQKGEILLELGRYEEAKACYDQALARANYHEKHPLDVHNGMVAAHAGALARQRRELASGLAKGAGPQVEEALAPALEAIRNALKALEGGALAEAAEHLLTATRLDPAHPQVPYLQAECLFREGHIPEAIEKLFASLQMNPHTAEAWALLGYLLHEDEDSELGAFCLQQATQMAPSLVNAKELLRQVQANPRARAQHLAIVHWIQSLQAAPQQAKAQAAPKASFRRPPIREATHS